MCRRRPNDRHVGTTFRRNWRNVGQHWRSSVEFRRMMAGRTRPTSANSLPSIAQCWSNLGRVLASRAIDRQLSGTSSAIVGQRRSSPGSPGVTCGSAWRGCVWQLLCGCILSTMLGLSRDATITMLDVVRIRAHPGELDGARPIRGDFDPHVAPCRNLGPPGMAERPLARLTLEIVFDVVGSSLDGMSSATYSVHPNLDRSGRNMARLRPKLIEFDKMWTDSGQCRLDIGQIWASSIDCGPVSAKLRADSTNFVAWFRLNIARLRPANSIWTESGSKCTHVWLISASLARFRFGVAPFRLNFHHFWSGLQTGLGNAEVGSSRT